MIQFTPACQAAKWIKGKHTWKKMAATVWNTEYQVMMERARHTSRPGRKKNPWGRGARLFALLSPPLPAWQIRRWEEVMLSETLKSRRQPRWYDEPWSEPRCLVSAHNAATTGPDALTNEDGLRAMTQVEFNSLFCQKGEELRERDASWALEVNSIYNKAQRCGFDLLLPRVVTFPVPACTNSGGPTHNSTGK